jgi:hypothetical protein
MFAMAVFSLSTTGFFFLLFFFFFEFCFVVQSSNGSSVDGVLIKGGEVALVKSVSSIVLAPSKRDPVSMTIQLPFSRDKSTLKRTKTETGPTPVDEDVELEPDTKIAKGQEKKSCLCFFLLLKVEQVYQYHCDNNSN